MSKSRTWDQYIHQLLGRPELEFVRKELNRATTELAKLDLKKHLSPAAQKRVKDIETRYKHLSKNLHQWQDRIDEEFKWAVKKLKTQKKSLEDTLASAQKAAAGQRRNIEKISRDLSKRIKKLTVTKAKRKKTAKKT
jgi:predicted  nucleic acid-binding Zn-ribbon protein